MEQAVRFCPDMNLLSFVCSKDHYLGTLDFYRDYYYTMCYPLIYRKPGGQYGILSIKGNGGKIDHIRLLEETEEYRRYLVSKENLNSQDLMFKAWIVDLYSNGETRSIMPSGAGSITEAWLCQALDEGEKEGYVGPIRKYATILFDPQYLCWRFCVEKEGKFYRLGRFKALFLKLDDDSASFRML